MELLDVFEHEEDVHLVRTYSAALVSDPALGLVCAISFLARLCTIGWAFVVRLIAILSSEQAFADGILLLIINIVPGLVAFTGFRVHGDRS